MLPTKLRALNDCSTDESSENDDAPIKITKEALETKAELQYSQALQYLAKDQLDEAEEQLSKLLQSEIISSLNTTMDQKDKSQSLLTHLKYCCLTNLGNLLLKKLCYFEALNHYQKALMMDNTDLNLWYRIGFAHTKLYQTDQAISAFLEGIKCNPNHWPTLDKLITLLYASNEYVCCLYYVSKSLNLDSGYLKGHFIKDIIFKKFPSLIPYFKSYCSDGGLDIKYTATIDPNIQHKILNEIEDLRKNDSTLCVDKILVNLDNKPQLFAKLIEFTSWNHFGCWLLQIYDNLFENYNHSFLYDPIEFKNDFSNLSTTNNYIIVDDKYIENNFEKSSFKSNVPSTKRRKSSPTLADQLKLSRRSARNKSNSKINESTLVKSVWNIIPQHLLVNDNVNDKLTINSIKWSDDSMDTMDLFRLYEFSDMLNDGLTENLLKNNITNEERFKKMNDENYFGSEQEKIDLNNFFEVNNKQSISNLLDTFLIIIANKWSSIWPSNIIQIYIDIFKRAWNHTNKEYVTYSDSSFDSLNNNQLQKVKDEIISILTYGELLSDLYFQLKVSQKPLYGSIFGGDFCSLWIGNINDILSNLDLNNEDNKMIHVRFLWLRALFNLQDKEIGLTCDLLNMLLDFIGQFDDFEIVLPNLEFFYRINKTITEKLIATLKRNNLLSTVKQLYNSKEYLNVVSILKETLKPQSRTFIEIPSYQTMTRYNQYVFMFNSFLELKNYNELFKWCEPCLYESILQYRKSLIEDCDQSQKSNQAEFINNVFYAMLEAIKIDGLNVFDNLSQGYKSRLIQSVINLLSYLIESPDGNLEINAVSPWLLIYNLLKYEESKTDLNYSNTCVPPSLSLLFIGHEFLGKRSWCCFEDGILLFLTLSEIEPYTHLDFYSISLVQQVDQIFYCLYTHFIKRNRPRNVQDHHSMGLALTWSRAIQLVKFYYPQELPSYDGLSKAFTINSDTEAIFKKVIALIPDEIKPNRLMDDFMAYIRGETNELPVNNNVLPTEVKDIFYLMADYNFKNKTWSKAIRYYVLDLCNKSDRLDSWAAMALARGSQIETKLNSCESIKNEGDIIKKAHMTGRCYKHSLKISPENTTLLIEYGTFSYSIHSFCSRLLKQETSSMSLQMFGELEKQKEKMIKIAKKCFQTANDVWEFTNCDSQDERWMHYYILGKIAEKNDENPILFLDHYLKAIQFLDSYGAKFPDHISYTPQSYSIEVLEVYYRIHAGILKLVEKHDNQLLNKELYMKMNNVLDQISNMSPIIDKNKKISQCLDSINNTNDITDNSNISIKKSKISDDSTAQQTNDTTNIRWNLIQKCLTALEDCIKRFPQHYKSYYRLAYFYFRSPYKDYDKFKNLMFGEQGLFGGQRSNNFFHGVWRIPLSEIDRPGSFAYHMSRCIHLLLDFLKETGDHKTLLDLAIQLKYTPDLEKKYLRDNEREDISKEALFLSVQILGKIKSEYAETNIRSKNELLLIQVYKSYKRVFKCWQQKDKTLSKLLLNVYQNIIGSKEDVSNDIIIKYCQKLQAREKEIEYNSTIANSENDFSSPHANSKPTNKTDHPQTLSTQCPSESQKCMKQLYSNKTSYSSPLQNTQEIMSMLAPLKHSPPVFPLSLEPSSYTNTLQQKLQATKQKLKRNNTKQKVELKRLTNNKLVKSIHSLPSSKPIKTSTNKNTNSKTLLNNKSLNVKPTKQYKSNNLELNAFLNTSHKEFEEPTYNLDSAVEIKMLPDKFIKAPLLTQKSKIINKPKSTTFKQGMIAAGVSISKVEPSTMIKTKMIPQKSKSVYINLDSAAEQARLKSTILIKGVEKKKTASLPLDPAILLSSCPGLSITPIVSSNDNISYQLKEQKVSHQIQTPTAKSKNCNFEHLSNSVTITKTEKNSNKKSSTEVILID